MALTLADIQNFVLVSLDSDTDELPLTLLNVFVGEGYDRIIRASETWSFFATEDVLTTTASVQAYNFAGDDALRDSAFPYALRGLTDVRGDTWSLTPVAHQAIRSEYRKTSPASSRPTSYSEYGDSIYLWPLPDSAYELSVAGYRAPIDWIALGSGSEPDAPDEFHQVIAYHALARGNAQQGDAEMAQYYDSLFDQNVAALKKRYATPRTNGPFIQNGGTGVDVYTRNGLGPLIYPFE